MADLTPAGASYDVQRVVADARSADPSLPEQTGLLLAREAAERLAAGAGDAPELARQLFAAHPESGATAANIVARAACLAYGVQP